MTVERHLPRGHDQKATRQPHPSAAMGKLPFSPARDSHKNVMFLQRTIGNQAVSRLVVQRRLNPHTGTVMREETPASGDEIVEEVPITPLQDVEVSKTGEEPPDTDFGRVVTLRGETTAHWDQSTHAGQTSNLQFARATGCTDCAEDDPCISVAATVTAAYHVPVSVSLPNLDSMGLNACEREQAQHWIDTVLSPHEQQHVAKFSTYNGTTTHTVRFTSCNSAAQETLRDRVESIVDTEHASRQSSAQSQSDALDPFNFDFELNCPEEEEGGS